MSLNKLTYVDRAEKIMSSNKGTITTTQIRKILTKVTIIYDEAKKKQGDLSEDEQMQIQAVRVQIIYDSGRDNKVENFIKEAKLIEEIKEIGNDREKLLLFCKYMEALVAYHRFYGGKDH